MLEAHLRDLPPSLAGPLDPVIARATAKDPGDRYETGEALASRSRARSTWSATRAVLPIPPLLDAETLVLRRPFRRRWLVAALVGLVAIAAGAAALTMHGSDGAANADPKLRTFVDRIENVLEQSESGRGEISAALDAAFDCSLAPRAAGRQIASVADNRQSILLQLGTLQTPTEQADEVVTLLQGALQHSIEADRHYRDGLFAVAPKTCPLLPNEDFRPRRGRTPRRPSRSNAVATFNPLADRFDRRTWSADKISTS